jgi:hypothetical protein
MITAAKVALALETAAHLELRALALEALDEMGISPAVIAGRSVGAIIGGA